MIPASLAAALGRDHLAPIPIISCKVASIGHGRYFFLPPDRRKDHRPQYPASGGLYLAGFTAYGRLTGPKAVWCERLFGSQTKGELTTDPARNLDLREMLGYSDSSAWISLSPPPSFVPARMGDIIQTLAITGPWSLIWEGFFSAAMPPRPTDDDRFYHTPQINHLRVYSGTPNH